jgi:hypothetical protein
MRTRVGVPSTGSASPVTQYWAADGRPRKRPPESVGLAVDLPASACSHVARAVPYTRERFSPTAVVRPACDERRHRACRAGGCDRWAAVVAQQLAPASSAARCERLLRRGDRRRRWRIRRGTRAKRRRDRRGGRGTGGA